MLIWQIDCSKVNHHKFYNNLLINSRRSNTPKNNKSSLPLKCSAGCFLPQILFIPNLGTWQVRLCCRVLLTSWEIIFTTRQKYKKSLIRISLLNTWLFCRGKSLLNLKIWGSLLKIYWQNMGMYIVKLGWSNKCLGLRKDIGCSRSRNAPTTGLWTTWYTWTGRIFSLWCSLTLRSIDLVARLWQCQTWWWNLSCDRTQKRVGTLS